MKKFFGILLIIIGLIMVVGGVSVISSISTTRDSFEGRVHESVSYDYRSSNDEQQMAGMALIGGGALLLIIGIIMTASKSKSQRKKEVEYNLLKKMQTTSNSSKESNDEKLNELSNKVKEYYFKKDYYSAITAVKQILDITPNDNRRYIDLACLYSLTHNLESYSALETAIRLGYSNYEKIKTDSNLDWLRGQPGYDSFVANGYRKPIVETPKPEPSPITQPKKESGLTDDVIQKLEKLAELKDKGILTEEEFQKEKSKILN